MEEEGEGEWKKVLGPGERAAEKKEIKKRKEREIRKEIAADKARRERHAESRQRNTTMGNKKRAFLDKRDKKAAAAAEEEDTLCVREDVPDADVARDPRAGAHASADHSAGCKMNPMIANKMLSMHETSVMKNACTALN